jgi:hypothetical protein
VLNDPALCPGRQAAAFASGRRAGGVASSSSSTSPSTLR